MTSREKRRCKSDFHFSSVIQVYRGEQQSLCQVARKSCLTEPGWRLAIQQQTLEQAGGQVTGGSHFDHVHR